MKYFTMACLCSLLWLTGCASTGVITGADSSQRSTIHPYSGVT